MCIKRCLHRHHQRGLTLIELIVFIVVIAIGLTGILGVLDFSNRHSVSPMLLKQQVAIAEALLAEIAAKPFTWCDPDDAAANTASSAADCSVAQGIGPTPGESRYSSTAPFDNVGDYHGFAMSGIRSPADGNTILPGLAQYGASVSISAAGSSLGLADNGAALRIDVTVSAPGQSPITLTGYRSRHAPAAP